MRPFRGIFEPIELGVTHADVPSVLETSVVFAMIVYGIVALVINAFIEWLGARLNRLDREDEEYRRQQLISQTLAATGSTSTVAGATATGAFDQAGTPPSTPSAPRAPGT
jgi:Kef-type K+ transport system membrane component KefB